MTKTKTVSNKAQKGIVIMQAVLSKDLEKRDDRKCRRAQRFSLARIRCRMKETTETGRAGKGCEGGFIVEKKKKCYPVSARREEWGDLRQEVQGRTEMDTVLQNHKYFFNLTLIT